MFSIKLFVYIQAMKRIFIVTMDKQTLKKPKGEVFDND